MDSMHIAYLGLGSNLGNPQQRVETAFAEMAAEPDIVLTRRSSLYRTAPVGLVDQPHFVNAVAAVRTRLGPHELLAALLSIERSHGRLRALPNGPRTLDLDILIYDDVQFSDSTLTLPHPRCHERAFVLLPLLEVAPDCVIPGRGYARSWLAACRDQHAVRIAEGAAMRQADGLCADAA
jgi:2-amino-4-hydroxy-6-hydroxymethyldihydropteridine diphosphokinase